MILQAKSLWELTEADLNSLYDNAIQEGKFLDYKRDLPGASDSDKKEFLFDVSSFANAAGGFLVFGIDEEAGIPKPLSGLSVPDPDLEVRKFQSQILDGIDPRIPGLELRFIPISGGKHILIIHIPKSWTLPHMVIFKGANKFYSRNSAGKHPVDVGELRLLFSLSETIAERAKSFRNWRLSEIVAGETPIQIGTGPKLILHLVPFQSFSSGVRVDPRTVSALPAGLLYPIGASGGNTRVNFDGFLSIQPTYQRDAKVASYLQVFANGIIETVNAETLGANLPNKLIPSQSFEQHLIAQIPKYLVALQTLKVEVPVAVLLTLIGVKDFAMATGHRLGGGARNIDRDMLSVPETIIDKPECKAADLKPMIDAVWNASGIFGSPYFDKDGNWSPRDSMA